MSKQTFAERCQISEQCLPDAPYRAMLTKLHAEMLAALAEQPAQQQEPWVGLTEQEHTDIAIQCGCMSADWVFYGATVERILKEKNS